MSAFYYGKIHKLATDLVAHKEIASKGFDLEPYKLAQLMHEMNNEALGQRYGDEPKGYVHEECRPSSGLNLDLAIFHRLSCYLYQCSEGNVPDTKLYKALREVQHEIAYHYMSEHTKAPFEYGE